MGQKLRPISSKCSRYEDLLMTYKVRTNSIYIYDPVGIDRCNPPVGKPQPGDALKVVKLPGCPGSNIMGHCHVNFAGSGEFAGLVCTYSLIRTPIKRLCCVCCGKETRGRQWHNLRTGYGICNACVPGCQEAYKEKMESSFGRLKIHYQVMW